MRGRLEGVFKDYKSDCWIVQFATPDVPKELEGMQDKDLSIMVEQYRENRSKLANSMYWKLLGEFAAKLGLKNPEAHNMMLSDYGQDQFAGGVLITTRLPDTEEVERSVANESLYHLRPTSDVNEQGREYVMMRGSKTYNTAEFSRLLNGLIEECNIIGVPTASPKDVETALSYYEPQ